MATLEDIITKRIRTAILKDVKTPQRWTDEELTQYVNDVLDEIAEKTFILVDSETPEICQVIVGVDSAKMAQGTGAATLQVVTAFDFLNQDTLYTMPVTDNIAMTACDAQAVSTYCRYLICTDSANAVTVTKGTDATTAATAILPLMTEGLTPIGMLLIATDATHTFTSGTTSLDATGITATFESSSTSFTLDSRVLRINRADLANRSLVAGLTITDIHRMGRYMPSWKTADAADPTVLVRGMNRRQYRVWRSPQYPDQILMSVCRRPLTPMVYTDLIAECECPDEYVKRMDNGIASKAYAKNDADTFNADKSLDHYNKYLLDIEAIRVQEIRDNAVTETNELPSGVLP